MRNISKKQTPYINNVPLCHGEVTVITSDHAGATMKHAARLSDSIRKAGLNVLTINCGMSDRRFRRHFYDTYGKESYTEPRLVIHSSVCGDLVGEREAIDQFVSEAAVGVVIISGWEFTSSTPGRKKRLLNYLRKLMGDQKVAIVIYSHTANNPVAGMIDKGGIGVLSLLAMSVIKINSTEILENIIKKPIPIIFPDAKEWEEIEESTRLFISKINGITTLDSIKPRSDSPEERPDDSEGEPSPA